MNLDTLIAKRLPLLLGAGVMLLLLNIGIYVLGVSRLDRYAQGVKEKVATNRKVLASTEGEKERLDSSVEVVRENRKVMDALTGSILGTRASRLVAVQSELQKLIEANGLSVQAVSYAYKDYPERKGRDQGWEHGYTKVTMRLPLSGPYDSIKKLIGAIHASPQFLLVDELSLSSSTQNGAQLRVSLAVSTYFVREKETRGRRDGKA